MNVKRNLIIGTLALLAGLTLGYLLFGKPAYAETQSPVIERLNALENHLARIENCACAEPCEYMGVVTHTVYVPLTTTMVITQVVPVTTTITSTTVITVTPVPTAATPEPTPVPTLVPTQEPTPKAPEPKQHCNQGLGNGSEGCDPGNSNHNHSSNDEGTNDDGSNKVPGNGGRKNEKVRKPKRGRSGK